jgi:hypothetical protein
MDALEAFEAAKQVAHEYLSNMIYQHYHYGPANKGGYHFDGCRRAVNSEGEPYFKNTWLLAMNDPQPGNVTIRLCILPKEELLPTGSAWICFEIAPDDLPQRVIEELRGLIVTAGGWTPDVMA